MRLDWLKRTEQTALLLAMAFLPLLEAPKNVAIVFFLVFWLINRWRSGDWGGPWDAWDSVTVFLIFSAYLSAGFGSFSPEKGLAAANQVLVFGSVFLAVRRGRFTPPFLRLLMAVIIASTLATLAIGYWGLWVTHTRSTLGLKSVGHVNHSAIYIALVFCLAYSWCLVEKNQLRIRLMIGVAACLLLVSLFVTAARGAIIPTVLFVFASILLRSNSLKDVFLRASGIIAIVALTISIFPGVLEKTKSGIESGQVASYRPALARTALLAAREYPLFGVGVTNFEKITPELARDWQEKSGYLFSPESLFFASHAHSLFFNSLAEQGSIGLISLLAFLLVWSIAVWRYRAVSVGGNLQTLWLSALGAWIVIVFGGIFNTTLHHENAILSLVLVGLWLGALKSKDQ